MISFSDLLTLGFFLVAGYFVYLCKEAVEILRNANFSNYKNYTQAIADTERKIWKPTRKRDETGLHRIKSDRTMITTKAPNGIAHTEDALVDITDVDPEIVMNSIDEQGQLKD